MVEQQASDGFLQPFIFPDLAIRGALVQVGQAWQRWAGYRPYPATVRDLLGQAMAAAPLMASTLKFEGRMSIQAQGDGAVPLLVVQADHHLQVRGMARWQGEIGGAASPNLFGKGQLGLIIEPTGPGQQRYEGLVPLDGERLADCLMGYFTQSEQLDTHLALAADETSVAGMLLQRMPGESSDDADAWDRILSLAGTLSDQELCTLPVADILRRLFHEETLQLLSEREVALRCRCSHGTTSELLLNLGESEVRSILEEQGKVEMACGFCGQQYVYQADEIDQLFAAEQSEPPTSTRH